MGSMRVPNEPFSDESDSDQSYIDAFQIRGKYQEILEQKKALKQKMCAVQEKVGKLNVKNRFLSASALQADKKTHL